MGSAHACLPGHRWRGTREEEEEEWAAHVLPSVLSLVSWHALRCNSGQVLFHRNGRGMGARPVGHSCLPWHPGVAQALAQQPPARPGRTAAASAAFFSWTASDLRLRPMNRQWFSWHPSARRSMSMSKLAAGPASQVGHRLAFSPAACASRCSLPFSILHLCHSHANHGRSVLSSKLT